MTQWMLYGAYGYTGKLILEEALRRGHKPVLAGRNLSRLQDLADSHMLDSLRLDLSDEVALTQAVSRFDLVLHAAGPFVHTSDPMLQACLGGGAHYLDITGEIPVFNNTFRHHTAAREKGIVLISGVGFDIVPTDCMARYVSEKLPDAVTLDLAFMALGQTSGGTAKSMLEILPQGNFVRRNGRLVSHPFGVGGKEVTFSNGKRRHVLPIPWGDLATAERTTGIPNVTTYMALPPNRGLRPAAAIGSKLMAVTPLRRLAQRLIDVTLDGPDDEALAQGRSYIHGWAMNERGEEAEAWLETLEGYRFTAVASVLAVEHVLAQQPAGALTPALAFGADFVLEVEDTRRFDALPEEVA